MATSLLRGWISRPVLPKCTRCWPSMRAKAEFTISPRRRVSQPKGICIRCPWMRARTRLAYPASSLRRKVSPRNHERREYGKGERDREEKRVREREGGGREWHFSSVWHDELTSCAGMVTLSRENVRRRNILFKAQRPVGIFYTYIHEERYENLATLNARPFVY